MTDRPKAPQGHQAKGAKSAVERWNHAVREAYAGPPEDADARAILEASDEEIDRQLREAGIDPAAEEMKADATYEAAIAKFGRMDLGVPTSGHTASVVHEGGNSPSHSTRRRRVVWLARGAAAAAATGGAAYVAGHRPHEEPKKDEPVVPVVDAAAPAVTSAPPAAPAPQPPPPVPSDDKKKGK
jgi:hypothetical protein